MKEKISIIIITADKKYYLLFMLRNFLKVNYSLKETEIIVVDNGEKSCFEIIKKFNGKLEIKYIRKKLLNRATARNVGASMAQNDILIFLDDDIIISQDFIDKHFKYQSIDKNLLVIGNTLKIYGYINEEKYLSDSDLIDIQTKKMCKNFKKDTYRDLFFANLPRYSSNWAGFFSSNVSLRKEVWESVGGFDQMFKGWGCEDLEYAYKLVKRKNKIVYANDIVSYHMEHTEGKETFILELQKNMRHFYEKYDKNIEIEKFWDFFRGKISLEEFDALFFKEISTPKSQHIYNVFLTKQMEDL